MKIEKSAEIIAPVAPEIITNILAGNWAIEIIKSALELGFFEALKERAASASEVATTLGYPLKGVVLTLDSLVGMKLLDRLDLLDGATYSQATYALNETSGTYLLKDSALFMGLYLKQHDELSKMWRNLRETIKTGRPVMEVNQDTKAAEIFPQLAESIIPLNYAIAVDAVKVVKDKLGPGPYKVLDVAAGSAVWSIPFAQTSARTQVTALDFAPVLAVTERITKRFEVDSQYQFLSGNWRDIQLTSGSFDVIILGHILHSEGMDLSRQLLKYCADALRPGGMLVIAEFFTNKQKSGPLHPLMFGLNMYLATTDGCVFSVDELTALCTASGFNQVLKHSSSQYVTPLLFEVK